MPVKKELDVAELQELIRKGASTDDIKKIVLASCEQPTVEDSGILRTNKGALMVRVSGSRWPIAMYKKDWHILLSKIPQIEEALDTLDILDENPDKSEKQMKQIENQEKGKQKTA